MRLFRNEIAHIVTAFSTYYTTHYTTNSSISLRISNSIHSITFYLLHIYIFFQKLFKIASPLNIESVLPSFWSVKFIDQNELTKYTKYTKSMKITSFTTFIYFTYFINLTNFTRFIRFSRSIEFIKNELN